jgi:polyisoprenyl-phosphate glycosyltransferase
MSNDSGTDGRRPLVSIVIPALNEAENVPQLMKRFGQFAVEHVDYDFELVLVDDGSTDDTADLALRLAPDDGRVTVIRLSRSFGSHYATSAGLARCAGDCAVVLGADLQEPPSLLAEFLAKWSDGFDVIWGVRRRRVRRSLFQEIASRAFSFIFTKLADLPNYPPEGPSGVLIDRKVIDEVRRLPERNRNVLALIAWLGFTQTRTYYDQEPRQHGTSRWTRRKMIKLAIDSVVQFSSTPLRVFSLAGITVALLGVLYAAFLVIRHFTGAHFPSGWPTVLVVVLVLGGTQLLMVGVIGEYLWRSVEESRGRPLYVVRDVRIAGVQPPNGAQRRPIRTAKPDNASIGPNAGEG